MCVTCSELPSNIGTMGTIGTKMGPQVITGMYWDPLERDCKRNLYVPLLAAKKCSKPPILYDWDLLDFDFGVLKLSFWTP